MKENVRMKQNEISQNIRKKEDCSSPYDSVGPKLSAPWKNLGSL